MEDDSDSEEIEVTAAEVIEKLEEVTFVKIYFLSRLGFYYLAKNCCLSF